MPAPNSGLSDLLRALAARPDGVHSSDAKLSDWTAHQVGTSCRRLVRTGELFCAKLGHKHARFFTSKEAAAAAVERINQSKRVRCNLEPPVRLLSPVRAHFADEEVRYSPDFKGVQRCPSWQPRFQAFEMPVSVYGGNQRGRVLNETEVL